MRSINNIHDNLVEKLQLQLYRNPFLVSFEEFFAIKAIQKVFLDQLDSPFRKLVPIPIKIYYINYGVFFQPIRRTVINNPPSKHLNTLTRIKMMKYK